MNKIYISIIATIIICGTTYAQKTEQEVKAELDIVNEQLMSLRQANMRSPAVQQIQEQMKVASDNYKKAIDSIPGMKELDSQIEKLREQMMQLHKQKMDLVRKNELSLKNIKNSREVLSERLRDTMLGGEQGKALMADQRRLMKEISEIRNVVTTKEITPILTR